MIATSQAHQFGAKTDISFRSDFRHEKSPRYQYRIRWYPQLKLTNSDWSLHGMMVTGDEFASSYNTVGSDENHSFKLRRLFARHQHQDGKTELGVIPTYKGRVSSTGLSKDGWIMGGRHVYNWSPLTKLEIVVGELGHINDPNALQAPDKLNYVELELSSTIDEDWSYELGLERVIDGNFARGEVRYLVTQKHTLAIELINRLDNNESKVVLSMEGHWPFATSVIEYFAYYSYVGTDFGLRAELTEDFVDVGHSFTFELEGELVREHNLQWFSKFEANEGRSRFQLGLKFKL